MVSLKEASLIYEEKTITKNIADLQEISLKECELEVRTYTRTDGTTFNIDVITVEGVEHRVPKSVLGGIQAILSVKPDMDKFRVVRKGTTKDDTEYTVVPL